MRSIRITVLLLCWAYGVTGGENAAYLRRTDNELVLGNTSLELTFAIAPGRCAATRLLNKLSGRTIPLKSDDFSIGLEGAPALRAADFAFQEAADQAVPGGRQLTLRLDSPSRGVRLDVVYELGDKDFFLRRRLELSAPKPLEVRQVDAWLAGLEGKCSHQGFGEPVLLDDTFWGLEYPGGHNAFANGAVRLTHYPGRTVTDRFVSRTAVLGVAEPSAPLGPGPGRVAQRFQQYVETFRVRRQGPPLFVNYNTWWTLMPPTEANSLALLELFRQRLFERYGESFDTFTLDDGWDNENSLWEIEATRFPRGFAPLLAPLRTMRANLGLWISPSSGYNHAPWGGTHGYERNSNAWFLCQSGPAYRRDMVRAVTALVRRYGLVFIKFDGFCAACEAAGHGHLPGNFAREANIDAYIDLLEAVRRERPDIFLDLTCGIWLSPWWLRYADALWGEVSGDYPDTIVPAPIVRDSATTTRDGVFRQRVREHPGFPSAAIEHLGIIVITPEKWEDNAMAVVGRGGQLLTLYINPQCFRNEERDWAFLGSLLKWTRHNASTLAHTELIGGDPLKREPYGYAHFDGPRGVISLRNPFIEPQTVKLKLDESTGWKGPLAEGSYLVARAVYPRQEVLCTLLPHSNTLEVTLQAFETMAIQIEPAVAGQHQFLNGARAQETERAGNRATYRVYGRPGQKLTATAGARLRRASLEGKEIGIAGAGSVALPIAFPGVEQASRVEGASLELRDAEAAWHIEGSCAATVPTGVNARLHVLCDPRGAAAGPIECSAQVGGKPVQVRAVRSGSDQAHSKHPWTWFEFPLPEGRNEVAITLKPAKEGGAFRGEVGWWLWAEQPLMKHTLTLEFEKPLPPAPTDPLPVPISQETEREIVTIQAPRLFSPPKRWPKSDATALYLDELPPDEATQGWGTLQKNQSVWEKEMIIAGRKFERGLGTHASGCIAYALPAGQFKRFRCLVGRDEHAGDGQIIFHVWLDGKKVFDSGPMTRATEAKPVDVDLAGAARLELRTLDSGDGISGDHGDWADARLVR